MPASPALDPRPAQPEHTRYAAEGWPCAILNAAQMLGPGDQAPDTGPQTPRHVSSSRATASACILSCVCPQYCNWAWPLTDIVPLEPFQPAKGAQGFWDWQEAA